MFYVSSIILRERLYQIAPFVEVGIMKDYFSYDRNLGPKTLIDLNYVPKCLSFGNYSVVHSSNVPTC